MAVKRSCIFEIFRSDANHIVNKKMLTDKAGRSTYTSLIKSTGDVYSGDDCEEKLVSSRVFVLSANKLANIEARVMKIQKHKRFSAPWDHHASRPVNCWHIVSQYGRSVFVHLNLGLGTTCMHFKLDTVMKSR